MTRCVYRRSDGSIVKYELREIKTESFMRFGIFDGQQEIIPEDRGEDFVKYEMER